jgi:hypothetical protein
MHIHIHIYTHIYIHIHIHIYTYTNTSEPETAIPTSDLFSAGASFTPSPVMPTLNPIFGAIIKNTHYISRLEKSRGNSSAIASHKTLASYSTNMYHIVPYLSKTLNDEIFMLRKHLGESMTLSAVVK